MANGIAIGRIFSRNARLRLMQNILDGSGDQATESFVNAAVMIEF